ncbi:diphthine methyl ester synthase-like isoform X2 [Xenia sp. Carnegie-2017]|uniref:diphthine methyl ester synthase-like isoform X2 n=1 Tax=Xenia sp. Carnegie-2017 TaxID=2897299 RepID=UPI001F045106|nr:diphthine methyl ester synthase-like isoform X2 [Xenia sp. Carnegie-2017]
MTFMTFNMTYYKNLHEVKCSWLLVNFDISVYGLPCVNLNLLLLKMLYLIGLGLGDVKDISVKGLEIVKHAKEVYLESYTSILTVGKDALEEYYGRNVVLADRDTVEENSDLILSNAKSYDVAFLVVGDPLGATTHSDLILRARKKNINYKIVHNASIMNAVACCGLQLYNFGETVSIVFWQDSWKPVSFYDKIASNRKNGLHTLCLLDIKVKERSIENMMRGRKIYEPSRFMTVEQAADQLLQILKMKDFSDEKPVYEEDTLCVALSRIGCDDQKIVCSTLKAIKQIDIGSPLHSLVIPERH